MYLVAIAWIYVVLMMAVAEAMSPQGTLLGAFFTLLLYGALPLAIVMYLMGTPHRRRARLAAEAATEGADEATTEGAVEPAAESGVYPATGSAADSAGGGARPVDARADAPQAASAQPPDRGPEPAADAVAPVRKES